MLETFTIVCIAFLLIAILKVLKSFVFKKKIEIVRPDEFKQEMEQAKNSENQVLVVFNDGYWEIKEETVTKEWSAETGTQTFVDFDLEINDKRYKQFMGKDLERDQFGEHPLKVIKELEVKPTVSPESVLQLKY